MNDLLEEKLGHKLPITYDKWLASCHYNNIAEDEAKALYQQELDFVERLKDVSLEQIAQDRIQEFADAMKLYSGNSSSETNR